RIGHFFFSSRRRHTRFSRDWSSDVCSSDLPPPFQGPVDIQNETYCINILLPRPRRYRTRQRSLRPSGCSATGHGEERPPSASSVQSSPSSWLHTPPLRGRNSQRR